MRREYRVFQKTGHRPKEDQAFARVQPSVDTHPLRVFRTTLELGVLALALCQRRS